MSKKTYPYWNSKIIKSHLFSIAIYGFIMNSTFLKTLQDAIIPWDHSHYYSIGSFQEHFMVFWSFPCSTKIIIILIQWLFVSRSVFVLYKTRWRLLAWFKTDNQLNRFFTHNLLVFWSIYSWLFAVLWWWKWSLKVSFLVTFEYHFSYRFVAFFTSRFSLKLIFRVMY